MNRPESLKALAERVNCKKYPTRWESFFNEVMDDFDKNGCIYLDPSFYDDLNRRFGILTEYLDLYKKAALEISKDQDLSRFLAVLCRGLQDRRFHTSDMAEFSAPSKSGDFAYELLTALAIASEAEMCHELLLKRKVPQEYIEQLMHVPEEGIPWFEKRNGRPGYALLSWNQRAIDGNLYTIGRLEIEIDHKFSANAKIFRNKNGETLALAHELTVHKSGVALGSKYFEDEEGSYTASITETADAWCGHPINDAGCIENRIVKLNKNDWEIALEKGDLAVNIHIPSGGGLSPQIIDDTMNKIKNFLSAHYPDYKYKAFVCYSWLMDPQLVDLLGEDTNISKFCNRFKKITTKSSGMSVFPFVFLKSAANLDFSELPENTTLERVLKKHYLEGKAIYEICGYFF